MERTVHPDCNTRLYWEGRYANESDQMWEIWKTGDLVPQIAGYLSSLPLRATVLDAGGGCGIVATRLYRLLPDIRFSGWDFSLEALKHAPANTYQNRICGDLQFPPFLPDSFDAVICTEVLEHMEDPVFVCFQLFRLARKLLIISVPNCNAIDSHEHLWSISEQDLGLILRNSGAFRVHTDTVREGRNLLGIAWKS